MISPPLIGIFAIQGAVEEHANCVKKCGGHVKEIRMPKDFDGVDGIILPGGESTTMAIVGERWGLFPKLRDWVSENKPIWGTCAGMILLSDHAIKQSSDGQSLVGGLDVQVCRNFFGSQMQSCDMEINMDPSMSTTDERKILSGDVGTKCQAIFIRAPAILSVGPDVEVLASVEARPHVSAKAAVLKLIEEEGLNDKTNTKKRRISTHRPVVDVDKCNTSHSGPSGNFGEADEEVEVFVAVQKGNILATAFHPELTDDIRWHQYFMNMVQRTRTTSNNQQQVGSEITTSSSTGGMKGLLFSLEHLTLSDIRMDISAHLCPKNFIRELQFVFPEEDLTDIIAIPTMQNAQMELVQVGDEIEVEKDRLLERFMATAKVLCEEFIHTGMLRNEMFPSISQFFWFDCIIFSHHFLLHHYQVIGVIILILVLAYL